MRRIDVRLELRLHITNLCLAVVSKEAGMLRECKDLLIDKVQELITATEKERDDLEAENANLKDLLLEAGHSHD